MVIQEDMIPDELTTQIRKSHHSGTKNYSKRNNTREIHHRGHTQANKREENLTKQP